ncbi:UNVERIFIED_CONTAM: hypothetical protein PYX00_000565 [Menopon gallinae]|uniref:C1q domain-containing protein n=1 Tax=Menopon gallinae TaxID=328185 RepID=A0AAW2IB24_9NEOP
MQFIWVFLGLVAVAQSAVPEAPRNGKGKRIGQASDCNGAVAFSAVANPKDGKPPKKGANDVIVFDTPLIDKSIGYSRESGIFTTHCPGLYQLTFTAYGDSNSEFSLRKRPSPSTTSWNKIVATGKSGGTHTVFLDMEVGEQAAVFVDSGSPSLSSHTFSGYRVYKKI